MCMRNRINAPLPIGALKMKRWLTIFLLLSLIIVRTANSQTISTIIGDYHVNNGAFPTMGSVVGPTTSITGAGQFSLAFDSQGNLYFTSFIYHQIFFIKKSDNTIHSFAGNQISGFTIGSPLGPNFDNLNYPTGIVIDATDNLYVAEMYNHIIRKINIATGASSVYAGTPTVFGFSGDGGLATNAKLYAPMGLAIDKDGNIIFADNNNSVIRKIDKNTGIITTIIGDHNAVALTGLPGPSLAAGINLPMYLAVDPSGNIFFTNSSNRVLKANIATGNVDYYAGTINGSFQSGATGGQAIATDIWNPRGLACDVNGNLYIGEQDGGRLLKVSVSTGIISTIAGKGTATPYEYNEGVAALSATIKPNGLIFDVNAVLHFISGDYAIRKLDYIPTVTVTGVPAAMKKCTGLVSSEKSFSVSAVLLSSAVVLSAPTGFEISKTSGSGFASTLSLPSTAGTLANTTVYVRMTAAATGTPSGNISIAATGATTQNVAVSGTTNSLPTITIGSVTAINVNANKFFLPYTAVTGTPDSYAIVTGTPTISGFVDANNTTTLSSSPIQVNIPTGRAPNTYGFKLVVTNNFTSCNSDTVNFTARINDVAPSYLGYNVTNNFTQGTTITNLTPTVSGGAIVTYSILPALPAGLTINTSTGVISGTPTVESGYNTYTITGTNTGGSITASINITIAVAAPTSLVYETPKTFIKGRAITTVIPTIAGGTVSFYSINPALPSGLFFSTSTGRITGTATVLSTARDYTVTATNATGSTTGIINITVANVPLAPSSLSYTSPNTFIKGSAITSLSPTIAGGVVETYTISPTLPTGLIINSTTGVISGTPTVVSAVTSYTVTATNMTGSTNGTLNILVNDIAPTSLSYTSPNEFANSIPIIPLTPSSSGGVVVSYSVSPSLPTGLSLNPNTGTISGTPTLKTDPTDYTITATNTGGNTTAIVNIKVNDRAPAISYTPSTISASKDFAITSVTPTSTGGAVVSYSISPSLPAGLILNTTTGTISGTATVLQSSTPYTVTATNTGGTGTATINIAVSLLPAPSSLSYSAINVFIKDIAITSLQPTVTGLVDTYTISPALPTGLSISATTGIISGTAIVLSSNTTYTVTATNTTGSITATLQIVVNDIAPIINYTPGTVVATKGAAIATVIPTSTGGAVANFAINPLLPQGLSFNNTTGAISGTATVLQTTQVLYTITATNSVGNGTATFGLTVNDIPPAISYTPTSITAIKGTAITSVTPASTAGAVVTFSISPTLPQGLSFNTVTGEISGTATEVVPSVTHTITASNSGGSATANFSIQVKVEAPSSLSYTATNIFIKNIAITSLQPTVTGTVDSYTISPTLPTGLIISATTGIISGTPTVLSTNTTYTVTATNTTGGTNATLQIVVNDLVPIINYTNTSPIIAIVGTPITSILPVSSGGVVETFSIAPNLPAGLGINTSTGEISGTLSANVSGTIQYVITASNSGGTANANVTISYTVSPTISNFNLSNVVYGAADINITAPLSNSPGAFTYSSDNIGVATIVSNKLKIVGAGTAVITASQSASGNYLAATITTSITVSKAVLTIKADDKAKCIGKNNPAFTYAVTGYVNGESASVFVKAPTLNTTALTNSAVGKYPITANNALAQNYSFNYVDGNLIINALPTVTVSSNVSQISKGRDIVLTANGVGSFSWTPISNIVSPNSAITSARLIENTTYTVSLTDANNCSNTASVSVTAIEDNYIEPTVVFTPNGDGNHDYFVIKNLDMYPVNKLQVFDRTGKVLYEKNNYSNNWNGIVNGGLLTKDTYFYILTVNGNVVKKGTVTVLR